MTVDFTSLKGLLELLAKEDIAEFEHESESEGKRTRVRIVRGKVVALGAMGTMPSYAPMHMGPGAPSGAPGATSNATAAAAIDSDSVDVTSPFVGTFYRSPTPDAPAFVENGAVVRTGQTLCIIEAMKLMNEIEAEVSGTVVECYAQNGKSVEFGQKLFRIKKA